ncbi:MAG TPA: peptidoglycan-binding domain-containing protein [Solirubrobacteraceae bacterium]|nr:peptidoglycan-binding domain-containing protein [Solirubrobacteraceae bacterium]
MEQTPLRAHRRTLVLFIAVAAAAAVILGAATGARAATRQDPGGATSTTGTASGSGTSGTDTSATSGEGSTDTSAARTLRRGTSGDDVMTLQHELRTLGYRLSADGAYGTKTVRSVRRYERKAGITVDGVVDPGEAQQIAQAAGSAGATQGSGAGATPQQAPGPQATLNSDGTATAPQGAPPAVAQIIQAGNQIASAPYEYGGGHNDGFTDSGYDCSGSVSYALHGAGLLKAPLDSGEFMSWGAPGPGQWVTIYANEGHVYMVVAGLRFDTSGADPSRWQSDARSSSGYTVVHPPGL